jgi:8-oxo-dGTP pyrophosphatase MutT (NUDIX family)
MWKPRPHPRQEALRGANPERATPVKPEAACRPISERACLIQGLSSAVAAHVALSRCVIGALQLTAVVIPTSRIRQVRPRRTRWRAFSSDARAAECVQALTIGSAGEKLSQMPLDPMEYFASLPKRRVGAGALLLDGTGNVLMVEPVYKEYWEIPGGIVEQGEDPPAACRRECLEELGLRLKIGRLLVLEHQTQEPPLGDSIMFVYDGGVVPAGTPIVLPPAELRSHQFVPPDRLGELTIERLARRIRFALMALRDGSTIELANGVEAFSS